ncbi:hypothetical protein PENSPDRAFT_618164 [Peniophora sp. CONT]|nr:hypothetical protein PENSPDRAFT_618164 [Peniophora sp. CONT]
MATIDLAFASRMIFVTQIHFCCMYAVCVWDWILSFKKEYHLIWKSQWTLVKGLYIFTRYWVLLVLPWVLWCYAVDHDQNTCNHVYRSPVALAMWNQAGAEAILLVRTYAYYNRNKYVLAVLSCMLSTVLAYQLWVDIKKMLPLPFLNGVSGPCLPMPIPGQAHLLGFFVAPLIFDSIITAMTLGKAFVMRQRNGPSSHIVQTFLKEGLFYFVLISCANLLNGIFYFQRRTEMSAIMIPLSIMLSPLLACRLILDIRERARNGSVYRSGGQSSGPRLGRPAAVTPGGVSEFAISAPGMQTQDVSSGGIELGSMSVHDDPDYKGESPVGTGTYGVQLPYGQSPNGGIRVDVEKGIVIR